MNMRRGFFVAVLATILSMLPIVPSALAQDYEQDPPSRAGRIGFVQGSVSFQPGGQGDWLEAVPNRPLTTGDNLWVDRDSRAEVQIGSTSIRLGPETSLTFLDLGNDVTQLRLSTGSLFFRVRHFDRNDAFEVDTPNLAFNVNQGGEFRLNVNENGDQTVATVWRGAAEVTGGGDSYRLQGGQQGTFSGVDQLSYDVGEIGQPDDFGRWAMSRDERQDRVRSRQYVSEEMTGYEDLDDYGRWHDVAGYGNVWTPGGVPGDWAPYRYGNWTYVSPWGWTWVEQEPWGFAPFHYGRWAFVESSWCWVPGPVAVVPVYSPALVAFVGGGGFSIGVGIGGGGGVGWFPLGPGEVFVPWYHTSPRYVENVNVTNTRVNVTQVTNVYNNVTVNHVNNVTYVNQRVTNSVTVVNHDTFVNARPVHENVVHVDARQIASAPVTHEVARDIQPARQSVIGPGRQVQTKPPEQVISRQVVATRQPTVVSRPSAVAGTGTQRAAAPPPVKTVRAAPPTEARPLERGARGGANPPPANAGGRPGQPENRPGAPPANNASPRPGQPENRPGAENNRNAPPPSPPANNRPGEASREVPRPGAPETNRPAAPENRPAQPGNARPGAPENRPAQPEASRPAAPENRPAQPGNNRPGAPENRPAAPENNNRPMQSAPRPPSANRPEPTPEQPRQNPSARPETTRPETPRAQPEQPARPPENRQQQPSRPPETRQQNAPPQSRQETAPRNESRPPAEAPRQENRSQTAPRPEPRPAQPSQQTRPPEQRNQKPAPPPEDKKNKDNKDKVPPQ